MSESALMPARPQMFGQRVRTIVCSFIVNGTAAPVLNSHLVLAEVGLASFVRQAAGSYDYVTLDRWPKLLGVDAHYAATGAAENLYAQASPPANIGSATNAVTGTVRTKAAGTNTDPAATNNLLTLILHFEDMPKLP